MSHTSPIRIGRSATVSRPSAELKPNGRGAYCHRSSGSTSSGTGSSASGSWSFTKSPVTVVTETTPTARSPTWARRPRDGVVRRFTRSDVRDGLVVEHGECVHDACFAPVVRVVVAECDEVDAHLVERLGHQWSRLEQESLCWEGVLGRQVADDGFEVDRGPVGRRHERPEICDDLPCGLGVVDERCTQFRVEVAASEHHVAAEVQAGPLVSVGAGPVPQSNVDRPVPRCDRNRFGKREVGLDRRDGWGADRDHGEAVVVARRRLLADRHVCVRDRVTLVVEDSDRHVDLGELLVVELLVERTRGRPDHDTCEQCGEGGVRVV